MLHSLVDFLLNFTTDTGYWGVFLLMTVESSFVPFPSELVIPPAAYLAAQGEMSFWLVVFFGILGSLVGALINYFLAKWLGGPVIYSLVDSKLGKIFFLSSAKVRKAEDYFLKYGGFSTFFGRLLPAIRQLISLPAGFSGMNLSRFIFFTTFGAGLWVLVLAMLGFWFGSNPDLLAEYLWEMTLVFVVATVVISIVYFWRKRKKV